MTRMLWIVTSVWLCAGCVNPFAPTAGLVEGASDIILTARESPEDVLSNFRYAYIFRDSLVYSELIDSSFIFIYFDPELEGTGRFDSWGRDVELHATARLFTAFPNINLEWNSTVFAEYLEEGEGTQVREEFFPDAREARISKGFELAVGGDIKINGTALFSFQRERSGDVWKIVRWRDESIF